MTSLEIANWSLVFLSAVLAGATIFYAIETYKMNKASKETQRLLEDQNGIMNSHNQSLREQADIQRNLADVLGGISLKLIRMTDEIGVVGQAINNYRAMIRQGTFDETKNKEMGKVKRLP